jgi:hypothetical protein
MSGIFSCLAGRRVTSFQSLPFHWYMAKRRINQRCCVFWKITCTAFSDNSLFSSKHHPQCWQLTVGTCDLQGIWSARRNSLPNHLARDSSAPPRISTSAFIRQRPRQAQAEPYQCAQPPVPCPGRPVGAPCFSVLCCW